MSNQTYCNEKRKHKASRYNTKDYHNDVVKKRKKTIKASSKTPITQPTQRTITTFLVEAEPHEHKPIDLKTEEFFKVPEAKKGFNFLSLRRSLPSIKTNVNIVGLIKKNVLNNNIVKWSIQPKIGIQRTTRSVVSNDNVRNVNMSNNNTSLGNYLISRDYHRLYVEDFILLKVGDPIKVLIPAKTVRKKSNNKCSFDKKFISCVLETDFPATHIGNKNNSFHVLSCNIKSCPNRNQALVGIDKVSLHNGFSDNQNYGYLLTVDNSNHIPLLK